MCSNIENWDNVMHGDIELIMIIVFELNRETKIHTPTFKMALTHRDSNYKQNA